MPHTHTDGDLITCHARLRWDSATPADRRKGTSPRLQLEVGSAVDEGAPVILGVGAIVDVALGEEAAVVAEGLAELLDSGQAQLELVSAERIDQPLQKTLVSGLRPPGRP